MSHYNEPCDKISFIKVLPGSEIAVFPLSGSFVHKSISTFFIVICFALYLLCNLFLLALVSLFVQANFLIMLFNRNTVLCYLSYWKYHCFYHHCYWKRRGKNKYVPVMRLICTPSDYVVIGSASLDHHDFWFYLSGLGVGNAWDVHINIVGKPDKNNVKQDHQRWRYITVTIGS